MKFGNKLIALLIVGVALLAFGCLQEKQWNGPSPSPVILPSPSSVPSPTLEVTLFPSPSPTRIPSPSPSPSPLPSPTSSAFSCTVTANPQSGVGPFDSIIFATFSNRPSDATSALIKCTESDAGQNSEISAQNGAGRTCHYGNATSTATFTARASAGSASCTVVINVQVNDSQPPTISNVLAVATQNNVSITWTTDKSSDSKVEYGTNNNPYSANITNSSATSVTSHGVFIGSLNPLTTYHYRVWSCSSSNVCSFSEDKTFITSAGPDTIAPTVTLNSPDNNKVSNSRTQAFNFTPTDNGVLANCSLWINDTTWKLVDSSSSISNATPKIFTYALSADGNFVWNVLCYDNAGTNAFASNRTITIDTIAPIVPFDSGTPLPGASVAVSSPVNIGVILTEAATSATLNWDGNPLVMSGSGTYFYYNQTLSCPTLSHTYYVSAVDAAGNTGLSETRTLSVTGC